MATVTEQRAVPRRLSRTVTGIIILVAAVFAVAAFLFMLMGGPSEGAAPTTLGFSLRSRS